MSPLAQRLRNAYEAHDRDEFDRALLKLAELERSAIPPARVPGRACVATGTGCVRGCAPQGTCVLHWEAAQ